MLVGLGEAALAPAAVSLIADMFAPGQRGRALSAYLIGASIGSGLSSVIPGWLATQDMGGLAQGWRGAFMVCGALGIPLAVLLAFNAEPGRRGLAGGTVDLSGIPAKLARLWSMRRLIGPLFGGFCLFYVALIGITSWTAVFIGRRYGLELPQFGPSLGLMLLVSGMGGYLLSGPIVDMPFARRPGGRLRILALLPLLALAERLCPVRAGLRSGAAGDCGHRHGHACGQCRDECDDPGHRAQRSARLQPRHAGLAVGALPLGLAGRCSLRGWANRLASAWPS